MTNESLRILLIEDNPGDARLIQELLRDAKHVRFTVVHVSGLADALKIPRGSIFDAVLLDLDLPESVGIATIIAAQDIFSAIPILALTGLDDDELALDAMRRGAQDYLVKHQLDSPLLTRAIRYAVERKKTSKALQESVATYRALVEAAPDSVLATDLEGWLTEVSHRTLELHRAKSAAEMIGMSAFDLIAPEDRERTGDSLRETLKEGSTHGRKYTMLRKDGSRFEGEMSTSVVRDADGSPKRIMATVRDITERRLAERALRESEELYRTLVETSPDAITLCKPDGAIVTANPSAARIHGSAGPEDLAAKSIFDLVAEEDRPRARAHYTILLDDGEPASAELTLLRMDGSRFAGELTTSLVSGESGEPLAIIAIGRDITARKRSEEDARRLDKLESLSILAGGVAHDFNNLLTAVITNLSMAREDVSNHDEALESLKEAAYAAKRARSLTRQLLTFARGGAPIKKAASVAELLESTAGFVLRGSTARAAFQMQRDLWAAEIDQDQMSQVIENLVINASQAMAGGGTIEIGARNLFLDEGNSQRPPFLAPGKYLRISIKDHGVGIPKQLLGKIFDPYFTTKQDGSGLGLAVAHAVIQKHGGHITVEAESGSGTEFTILLPASEKSSRQSAKASLVPARGTGRVLVMDDDPLIQRSLTRMLTRLGYSAEVSPDGADAIVRYRDALANGRAFDAVIMDLTVPGGMGGVDAIKEIKRLDPKVRAIVSSGYSTDQVMNDHKRYGFAAVVTKPYDISEMAGVLNDLICGTPQELETTQ